MSEHQAISDELSDAFGDVVFSATSRLVSILVKSATAGMFAEAVEKVGSERVERFVRGALGMGLVTIGVSQMLKAGLTLADAHDEVAEAWADWSAKEPTGLASTPENGGSR